jgi:glycosyltransferase involved in cell wall biosynthesis
MEIAHLPHTFVGCEVSTYFPEDNCKLHVLVYRITPAEFKDIDKLRENVFELVPYLVQHNIPHALAHPFYLINDRLTVEHFEQCLLLFSHFELNGNSDEALNRTLEYILSNLNPTMIDILADRHKIAPLFGDPWRKGFTGGSDDHSSLNIAQTYTEVAGARNVSEFWDGIHERRSRVGGRKQSTPLTLAHNIYGVAYQYYRSRFNLPSQYEHNVLMQFLDRMLQVRERKEQKIVSRLYSRWKRKTSPKLPSDSNTSLTKLLQYTAHRLISEDTQLAEAVDRGAESYREPDRLWFRFSNRVSNDLLRHLAGHVADRVIGANPFDLFHGIGSAGALYTMIAPYFVAYAIYCKNRRFSERVEEAFANGSSQRNRTRVGHFTDTFEEVNGVALTLKKQTELAQKTGKDLTMLTCTANGENKPYALGARYFQPVGVYELPEYPEQKLFIPPLLEMMQFCYEHNFTHIHAATPGPIGLCALAIARIMKLPFYTTYHTAVPQFAWHLKRDSGIEDLMWTYMLWFYDQSDVIFSPSKATAAELIEKGISADKIKLIPRGVDIERFHPGKCNEEWRRRNGTTFLYVGRVSKEKNLPLLCRAFARIAKIHPEVMLVVVGDGPYLQEMKETMDGTPCVFTGYLEGDELASIYASCDAFVFPSTTDTFGNVVLEAQASGIPIIVTNMGGPRENVIEAETALVIDGDDEAALVTAMKTMLAHPERGQRMGENARRYAETRSFEKAFDEYWKLYDEAPVQKSQPSIIRPDFAESLFATSESSVA